MKVLQGELDAAMSDKARLESNLSALAAEHDLERTQLKAELAASAANNTLLHATIKELQNQMEQVCRCHI